MTSDRKRVFSVSGSERDGLCRATTRKGEPCRRKALDADGLCLVHNGSQDMRELGRLGGRATPKSKRPGAERESLREFLRREVNPARVWAAIEAGLESGNDRDRLAASKLLLSELYEPAADRERDRAADVAASRARFESLIDAKAARAALTTLAEQGVIRPGPGRPGEQPFAGVVRFGLRELAEWAATWARPGPLTVADVTCGGCGKAGVRLVKEGERVDGGPGLLLGVPTGGQRGRRGAASGGSAAVSCTGSRYTPTATCTSRWLLSLPFVAVHSTAAAT